MSADAILVIDAGTSRLRGVLAPADGASAGRPSRPETWSEHSEPWQMFQPEDTSLFGRELRADEVRAALRRILEFAAPHRDAIAAVAVTGQREGLVFVDRDGTPLLVSPNIDARASSEGMAIDAEHGRDVYATTGHLPSLMHTPAKYRWMIENRPHDAARVAHAVPLADWLAFELTGELRTSASLAAENGMLDVSTRHRAEALWQALDVPPSLIPPVVADGSCVGRARAGGLKGLPVILAGGDTQCALVGMGATSDGDVGAVAGWSTPVQMVTSKPIIDEKRRTWTGLHVAPGQWVLESNAGDMGRAWDWAVGVTGWSHNEASWRVEMAPTGSNDVMAVLGRPRMQASGMNAGVGGWTFPLPLVMSAPNRESLLRAILESAAFAIRANLEQLEEVSGARVRELSLGGGMSLIYEFWAMVAWVTGRPVHILPGASETAAGAAAVAGVAVGLRDTVHLSDPSRRSTITPPPQVVADYEDYYQRWLEMCERFEEMA